MAGRPGREVECGRGCHSQLALIAQRVWESLGKPALLHYKCVADEGQKLRQMICIILTPRSMTIAASVTLMQAFAATVWHASWFPRQQAAP